MLTSSKYHTCNTEKMIALCTSKCNVILIYYLTTLEFVWEAIFHLSYQNTVLTNSPHENHTTLM